MKFINTVSVVALALGVVAEPTANAPTIVQRDLPTIQSVLAKISDQTASLDKTVLSFSSDITAVQAASDTLLATIQAGISTIKTTSPLDLLDGAQVGQSVITLNTTVLQVVTDLISKKSALASAGVSATVLKSLQDQKVAADALAAAITLKLPNDLQELAGTLSAGISNTLKSGVDAFLDQAGSSFPGLGGPPPSSAPATSAAGSSYPTSVASSASATSSASRSLSKASGAYDLPTSSSPSSPSSKPTSGYDLPPKSSGGYGYPSAPASSAAPPKSTGGYGSPPPASAPPAPPKSSSGYNYPAPPASSPASPPPAYTKSKTAPLPQYTGGATTNGLSQGLVVLAAVALVL